MYCFFVTFLAASDAADMRFARSISRFCSPEPANERKPIPNRRTKGNDMETVQYRAVNAQDFIFIKR
jgi:hypothetical protein